jgi:hypothetical protein
MMSWKFSPKEILHQNELRKELHTQIKCILTTLADIAAEKGRFVTVLIEKNVVVDRGSGSMIDNNQFKLLTPFPPVIFELY